ncbi:MAG: response regulator transcription factor [Thermomicrobium sp.]|nr:response regulator transcription factor [Thermomicrobium sp.]
MDIGLLLSDDLVVDVVRVLLERRGHRVLRIASLSSLLRHVSNELRVVLLGSGGFAPNGDVDGLVACERLRAEEYRGGILVLTRDARFPHRLLCFEKGADDVFVWPGEPAELVARVEALARRAVFEYPGQLVRVGGFLLDTLAGTLTLPNGEVVSVSPTETRLLECLLRNAGIIVPRDRLIERVWGYDYGSGGNRLEVVIRRIRLKIEPNPDRPQFLRTVRGVGYVFRVTQPATASVER